MRSFGAAADETGRGRYEIAGRGYRAVSPYAIEPDASSASYFFAAAAIVGGRVRVEGLGSASRQGDLGFVDLLEQMGAAVERGADFTEVRGTGELHGIDVDLAELPDMAQTLAAVAVFADSPTTVRGVGFIRCHETDRHRRRWSPSCAAAASRPTRPRTGFIVRPGTPEPATIQTYDDHRMAMSFALLGLRSRGDRDRRPRLRGQDLPRLLGRARPAPVRRPATSRLGSSFR